MEYAKDLHNGKTMPAEAASRRRIYVCPRPGCGGRVYLPHVYKQRPHFRHYPGEGTPACDQYFPGASGGYIHISPTVSVEEDPAELGVLIAQCDGSWSLGLRLPDIPSGELGAASLGTLRSASVQVYAGPDRVRQISALDLRPGVGYTRVAVSPSLQSFRTEAAGTWPVDIDKGRWALECRGIEAKGSLFRIRGGEWTRLVAGSGVRPEESLLVLAEERCAVPAEIVTETHARMHGSGLHWVLREIRIPEEEVDSVTAWITLLGHEIVPRTWGVELATPARAYTEVGDPIFWIGDEVVLKLEAPQSGADAMLELRAGTNTHTQSVALMAGRVAHVSITALAAGFARFGILAERLASLNLAFIPKPSGSVVLSMLARTPRLRVLLGEVALEAWCGLTHKVRFSSQEAQELRIEPGQYDARLRVTIWERGKQKSRRGLDSRTAERTIQSALRTASRIEIDAGNLGRLIMVSSAFVRVSSQGVPAQDRLAWRDSNISMRVLPNKPGIPAVIVRPGSSGSLVSRRIGAVSLVRARLDLRRHRKLGGTSR
jgi:hypothetical protein